MFEWDVNGALSGLLCGALFGFVLESAGFGSPLKLTAQFALRDWSVFKVMFTAIVVAALGIPALQAMGWMATEAVYVPSALLMASAIGGLLVGAGFAVGGYCPGTSVVGLASGRMDALVFLIGLLLGTVAFAGVYGPAVEAVMGMWELPAGDTFSDAFGWPLWAVLVGMVAALVGVFFAGRFFEGRSAGVVGVDEALGLAEHGAAEQRR